MGRQGPEAQAPRVVQALDHPAFDSGGVQGCPVLFAAFMARCALKDGVEAVAAIIDWPKGQFVGDGTGGDVELGGDRQGVSASAAQADLGLGAAAAG